MSTWLKHQAFPHEQSGSGERISGCIPSSNIMAPTSNIKATINPEEAMKQLKVRLAFARFKVQNGMINQNIDQIEHSVDCRQSRAAAVKEQQEALSLLQNELPPTPPLTYYGQQQQQQQQQQHHVRADEEAIAAQNLVLLSSPSLLPSLHDNIVQVPDYDENSRLLVPPLSEPSRGNESNGRRTRA